MNKFKVGDRVKVYSLIRNGHKGVITKIDVSREGHLRVKFSEDNIIGFYHYKQCRKLVNKCKPKPKPKFKVGDRVQIINSWDICQISNTIYNYFVDKINLNKKKLKFKVGDRVVAITIAGNKYKGTIVEIIDTTYCTYYDVKFDNKNLISIIPFPTNQLKKLRKKKTVFKIGDRVIFKKRYKGTILDIEWDELIIECDDEKGRRYHLEKQVCKKLIRKKPEFKEDDRVNAYNDNGVFIGSGTIISRYFHNHMCCNSDILIRFDNGQEGHWKEIYLKKLKNKCKIK